MTDAWPAVLDEFETIQRALDGYSISRYGDGEMKIMYGSGYVREPKNLALTAELNQIFDRPAKRNTICIPTMDPAGPKYKNWLNHHSRFFNLINNARKKTYGSAFITRPDSSPWIHTVEYAQRVERLWKGKTATVVCEKHGSMYKAVRIRARKATFVQCPRHEAFAEIDLLEHTCLGLDNQIVIISAGPTATCLADRLCEAGVHAIDLGSAGGWLTELLS